MPLATTSSTTTTIPTTTVPTILSHLFSVSGKNVLITGGSRGIGLMIAKAFVQAGANVLLTSRSEEACREAAQDIQSQYYVASNVSHREGCEALANHVSKVFHDRLDILINNVSFRLEAGCGYHSKIACWYCIPWCYLVSLFHHHFSIGSSYPFLKMHHGRLEHPGENLWIEHPARPTGDLTRFLTWYVCLEENYGILILANILLQEWAAHERNFQFSLEFSTECQGHVLLDTSLYPTLGKSRHARRSSTGNQYR
jgi:hypothetical protein